jgi:hypothetical protein
VRISSPFVFEGWVDRRGKASFSLVSPVQIGTRE